MRTLIIWIIIIAIAWFLWKNYSQHHTNVAATAGVSAAQQCTSAASMADDTWGSGVGHFANPPYDTSAWDEFRSRVETQARQAEEKCLCADSACTTAKNAMGDLRNLVAEMDQSLRSGSPPPSDLVQRQEAIDTAVNSARDAAK
ncbi:MAG TPA: hypothetical protein VL284_06210 [Thermoanaerobaculia bacterium]|nr:hypothetical protein [Thermoanaerobaculia bacterium]